MTTALQINYVDLPKSPLKSIRWGIKEQFDQQFVICSEDKDLIALGVISSIFNPEEVLNEVCQRLRNENLIRDDDYAAEIFDNVLAKKSSIKLYGTPFQLRVWQALSNIPHNKTCTYRDIAEKIGQPKAARAVGQAVGRNPVSYLIPCHRVVGSNGALGGFRWGVDIKTALLTYEKQGI